MTTTTRIPISRCECGAESDHVTGAGTEPTAGSLSICIECGRLARFGADLVLVLVELEAIDVDDLDRALLKRLQAIFRAGRPS